MCNYILFLNGFKIKIFKKIPIIPHIFFLKISMYPPFSIIHSCAAVHYSCLGIKTSFDWIKPSKFARIGIEMTFTLILKIIVSLNCMIYLPFELRNSDFKVNKAARYCVNNVIFAQECNVRQKPSLWFGTWECLPVKCNSLWKSESILWCQSWRRLESRKLVSSLGTIHTLR